MDPLSPEAVEMLKEIQKKGVKWLMSQRNEEYGWDSEETPRVVVALATAVEDWPAQNDLVAKLIVKQLEIELFEKLLRFVFLNKCIRTHK